VQDVQSDQTTVKILIPSILVLLLVCLMHFVIEIRYNSILTFRQAPIVNFMTPCSG
jgi:hypothetical protein